MDTYRFGEILDQRKALTAHEAQEILAQAKSRARAAGELPLDAVLDVLDAVGRAWASPKYPLRRKALRDLPARIGFSPEMVEQGILVTAGILRRENLLTRLECDLGDPAYLDGPVYHRRFGGYYLAHPMGVVAHVSAGNVFVGGVDTLIQGLVTKNVNLMKMSSADPVFPVLFARSVKEHDAEGTLAGAMALLQWRGGDEEVEKVFKQGCDAVVVYGGAETVRAYRKDLGLHTRLVEYGPKYSLVLAGADGLKEMGLGEAARRIARDVIMWEQSACSSPHAVYVEGGDAAGRKVAAALAGALATWAEEIPPGPITDDEATEITRVREMARYEACLGKSELLAPRGTEWTVVLQKDPAFQTSCLNRTVFVKPVKRLEDALAALAPMGSYIQTVALLTGVSRARELTVALARMGADRMVAAGKMAVRKHGTPHDGGRGLADLVRWASLGMSEGPSDAGRPFAEPDILWRRYDAGEDRFDFLPDAQRDALTLVRLKDLVARVTGGSPYYRRAFRGIRIESLDDIRRLPILTGHDLLEHVPPYGEGLLTDGSVSGWVFASGGTTGKPKLVYRTMEEQHYNASRLGKGLALAGIGPGDTVANLLYAGHMWASFVSYNMALEHTGCRILPIAGNLAMEDVVQYLRLFDANAAVAVPSVLIALAQHVEAKRLRGVRIRKIITGGEHLFDDGRRYLSEVLGIRRFASMGYTSNDTGAIAFPCARCAGGLHHVHEDLHLVEIVDATTGRPCPPGVEGKLLVTNLQRVLMPTIRYEIGDVARWVGTPCPCGRRTRLFELLGRCDDVLRIAGGSLAPEAVARAVQAHPGLSQNFQMAARTFRHLDQVVVRVEAKPGTAIDAKEAARAVRDRLYEVSNELRAWHEGDLIADVAVEVLPPDGLPRNPRTGKIRLTVDERH